MSQSVTVVTEKEAIEIVGYLAQGMRIGEISDHMRYADERPLHYRLKWMRDKYEARTNPELVAIFFRKGLLK